jgi:predicted ABC-type sugar transport system permease subunit
MVRLQNKLLLIHVKVIGFVIPSVLQHENLRCIKQLGHWPVILFCECTAILYEGKIFTGNVSMKTVVLRGPV